MISLYVLKMLSLAARQVTFQSGLKWQFCPVLHKKVAIRTRAIRLETCASALETFDAPVSGKKKFEFFAAGFVRNFPLVLR